MRRWWVAPLVTLAAGGALLPGSTGAATKQLTVSGLGKRLTIGYVYIDPKLKKQVDSGDLQAATLDASQHDQGWRFAALSSLPKGVATPEAAAQAVLDRLRTKKGIQFVGVALVQNGTTTIGGATRQPGRNQLQVEQAAQAAQRETTTSVAAKLRTFAENVQKGVIPQTTGSSGGGTSIWIWLLLLVAVGAIGLLFALRMRARSRELRQRARGGSIGTARQFHMQRLDDLSRRHGDLVRAVAERPDDPALAEHHETAGAKLVALRRQLPTLFSPRELRTCAAELDQVEWHVECSEALVSGNALPLQPSAERPGLCFFTHEHGLGTVELDFVKPDASTATVWVCPANAVALGRGEQPLVSSVPIGSRLVPWPAAPTWYGAPGWSQDDLQGLEYQGREIWGRDVPERLEPVDVPPDAAPGVAPDALLLPGVSTPLPPGVTPPPDDDGDDELPPGVTQPPEDEPPVAADDAEPPVVESEPAVEEQEPAVEEQEEPPQASMFEELDAPPPAELGERAVAVGQELEEVTAEHPVLDGDHTAAYDPMTEDEDADEDARRP